MKLLLAAFLLGLVSAPLAAQETGLKVGDDAVDIEVSYWVNTPAVPHFSELKGDVILLKSWGIN